MQRLEGKTALITGAARGIGLAFAAVFLASAESDYVVGRTYNVDGGNCLS